MDWFTEKVVRIFTPITPKNKKVMDRFANEDYRLYYNRPFAFEGEYADKVIIDRSTPKDYGMKIIGRRRGKKHS